MELKMVRCPVPECGLPARVTDQWTFDSTDGSMEHVKIQCRAGHTLTPSVESLRGFLILHPSLGNVEPAAAVRESARTAS